VRICMAVFTDLRFDFRVYREARSLVDAGHRVTIVSTAFADGPPPPWEGVTFHLIPIDRSRSLRRTYPSFWRQAYPLLVEANAQVYHAHDLDALWPAARAARHRGAQLVYDSHEFFTEQSSLVQRPPVRMFWLLLERLLIRRAHSVVTVADPIARKLEGRYGLPRVHVVRNLPPYRAPVASDVIRAQLHIPATRPVVLYQGGFLTDNGLGELVEASAGFADAVFVLLGDGPCEAALQQKAQNLGLTDRVRFIPRVPFQQLHSYTCSADVGLCLLKGTGSSSYHSLPNKLFEYLMAGLPVVASNFSEMERVVSATGCGITAPPTDQRAVQRAIADILGDPHRLARYREASLAAARSYNWEAEAPRLLEVYQTL
jgi:glycosyltransferase involved in cell wall biosynthesis